MNVKVQLKWHFIYTSVPFITQAHCELPFHYSRPLWISCQGPSTLNEIWTWIVCRIEATTRNCYNYVIMSAMASQITGVSMVCSNVYSGGDQRKQQSSASLAFVRGIHRSPVNSPHKGPVTRKVLPFDDVIMYEKATVNLYASIVTVIGSMHKPV